MLGAFLLGGHFCTVFRLCRGVPTKTAAHGPRGHGPFGRGSFERAARWGAACSSTVRSGAACSGVVRSGTACSGATRLSAVRSGVACSGAARLSAVRYGRIASVFETRSRRDRWHAAAVRTKEMILQ